MDQFYKTLMFALLMYTTGTYAAGDEINGQRLYESRCIGCHSIDSNRVGPSHRGVFKRRAGAVQGYDYSDAVKNSKVVWTAENLDRWLSNPEKLIPGQKMGYSISDAQDRADLITYLMTTTKTRDSVDLVDGSNANGTPSNKGVRK